MKNFQVKDWLKKKYEIDLDRNYDDVQELKNTVFSKLYSDAKKYLTNSTVGHYKKMINSCGNNKKKMIKAAIEGMGKAVYKKIQKEKTDTEFNIFKNEEKEIKLVKEKKRYKIGDVINVTTSGNDAFSVRYANYLDDAIKRLSSGEGFNLFLPTGKYIIIDLSNKYMILAVGDKYPSDKHRYLVKIKNFVESKQEFNIFKNESTDNNKIKKEARYNRDKIGMAFNYKLEELSDTINSLKYPEVWAEKYYKSANTVIEKIDDLIQIFNRI